MRKELYFTAENIHPKGEAYLNEIRHFRKHRPDFNPARAALLILDMQRYFLEPDSHAFVPSAPAILPGVEQLSEAFTAHGQPVICTSHLNTEDNAGMMATWWQDVLDFKSAHSQNIIIKPNFHSILKTQYDAFYKTELNALLSSLAVQQVVITGVMTHLCCETTARSAFVHGYEVFFCVDGTATYTEAFHRATLLNLSHGFAVPVTVGELLSNL